jgi:hypothetical protein
MQCLKVPRRRLSERQARIGEERDREGHEQKGLGLVEQEFATEKAQQHQPEDAELQHTDDDPEGVDPREGVDERPLELLLDRRGGVSVVVEELRLARVEEEEADEQIHARQGQPVGRLVEDRSTPSMDTLA